MLETRIEELTRAVEALAKAIGGMQAPAMISAEFTLPEGADLRPGPLTKVEDPPTEPSPNTPPTSQTSAEESKPVVYSNVAALVTQIAKTDLAKAKAALARLGVKHGKELSEAQWPEAVAYLTRVAAGEVDPEASHG
jgi:hypothetical protein